jgi:hypothetical protein
MTKDLRKIFEQRDSKIKECAQKGHPYMKPLTGYNGRDKVAERCTCGYIRERRPTMEEIKKYHDAWKLVFDI